MSWRTLILARAVAGCLVVAGGVNAVAQAERDPTLAPARPVSAASAPAGSGSGASAALVGESVMVIVRDGRPFLVVGTRLFGQGQMIGSTRIERISETEVWLREGKTVIKKPIFAGVVRRDSATSPPVPSKCTDTSKTKAPTQSRASRSENCPP